MLYRLEISNFYSIREPQAIDLRVGGGVPDDPDRLDALFPGSKERAPRVTAFFGPNASGKSTALKALSFIAWFARDSFQLQPNVGLPCGRFNDEAAQNEPIRLAIEFSGELDLMAESVGEETEYGTWRYDIELVPREGSYIVGAESLRQRALGKGKWSRVFERKGHGVTAGTIFGRGGYQKIADKVRDNASVISTFAQFEHKPSLRLQKAARSIMTNILFDRAEGKEDDAVRYYSANAEATERLNREIQRIDLGIRKMHIEPGPYGPQAFFEHEGLQHRLPLMLESHGTRSFVRNFPLVQHVLQHGGIAVVDEIDLSIHPLVLPEIIRWFYDPEHNPHKARLWMTCHSATLLDELAKEEVFFCEKDGKGRTSIFGLQNIRNVRRTDNRYRKYLSGVYGAVPNIG